MYDSADEIVTFKYAAVVFSHVFILPPEVGIPSRTNDNSVNTELRKSGIDGTNLLINFHEDRTKNVASIVKNAKPLFHEDWTINVILRVKNAPPPGGHVF
ncbi:hypothetical protein DPMN_103294 [Dreissena polymorpha]|uniref:Uncharacterized protein n=1 Tax=Dreissena polymorpha TaxID=45954 RepID=A0A9D4HE38_DREPO|nr:hypothetical protein DPMN_103294 [Dreissena polymorpha]